MELEIGKTYDVNIGDCCVSGYFTATLTSMEEHRDDEYIYRFNNGVILTETGQVFFKEVEVDR